jgi:hypothetical protein
LRSGLRVDAKGPRRPRAGRYGTVEERALALHRQALTIVDMNPALGRVDDVVAEVLKAVAARLTQTGLPGAAVRERTHLDPYVKDEFERRTGRRPPTRTVRSPDFRGLGPVDVVVERPRALLELKWAYGRPAKIFESVWDATKLALLGAQHGYDALYVVCGASTAEWETSESSELFASGEIDALALWQRPISITFARRDGRVARAHRDAATRP